MSKLISPFSKCEGREWERLHVKGKDIPLILEGIQVDDPPGGHEAREQKEKKPTFPEGKTL